MHPTKTHPPTAIASDFYQHPYGGIARDVCVSREGFARFFEVPVEIVEMLEPNVKQFDVFEDEWTEILGYIDRGQFGKLQCRIVFISRDHSTVGKRLRDAPYLWKEVA